MLRYLTTLVFGRGSSGKREGGWVVFVITTGILLWLIREHAQGKDMSAFIGLMTIAWPASMGAAVGPHVLHHIKPPK